MKTAAEWLKEYRQIDDRNYGADLAGVLDLLEAIQADALNAAVESLRRDLGHDTDTGLPLPPQELKWIDNIRKLKEQL